MRKTPVVEETKIPETTTAPATTVAETTTKINETTITTEAEIKESEFEASRIKNRLRFPNGVQPVEEWFVPTMAVPMWFVQEWSKTEGYEYVAS